MDYIKNNYDDIDEFIEEIAKKYNIKKKNKYDDESIIIGFDGRNNHGNNGQEL